MSVTIDPVHRIGFPESTDIVSALFSKDGDRLFVHLKPVTVNVWHILVDFWAYALGAPVAVVVLIGLVWAIRVLKRRRVRGSVYCRRCNYCLDGIEGDCPECGRAPGDRQAVGGVSTWRRLAAPVLTMLLAGGVYGSLFVFGLPREVRWWCEWHSTALAERATNTTWLKRYARGHDRIVVLDPETGETLRVLTSLSTTGYANMVLAPDGAILLMASQQIMRIHPESGRLMGRTRLHGGGHILGVAGGRVILCVENRMQRLDQISAWDFDTGELEVLYEADMYLRQGRPVERTAVMISAEPLRVLSAPTFMETYYKQQNGEPEYVVRDLDLDAGTERSFALSVQLSSSTEPNVDARSGLAFFNQIYHDVIHGFDLETFEHAGSLEPPGGRMSKAFNDDMTVHAERRWLIVTCFGETILIRDIDARRWAATLRYPSDLVAPKTFPSPDGRRMAAIGFENQQQPAGPPFIHHLLIYDLSELD